MAIPLKYNVRSLLVRRVSTAMTGGGIALVVAVFVIVMALVAGLNSAISDTGDPDNVIVLRKGATTETYSAIQLYQFDAMKFLPEIRREPGGEVDASPELPVQALMYRSGGGRDNIVVRGVLPIALKVHPKVKIVEGRMFNPSVNEVIVGKGLMGHYENTTLGSTLRFGRGKWKVVGIMTAEGGCSSLRSRAISTTCRTTRNAARITPTAAQTCARGRHRCADSAAGRRPTNQSSGPDRGGLLQGSGGGRQPDAVARDDCRGHHGGGRDLGAMNTMYAAVASRTAEIGTLRALGFAPSAVMASFLLESLVLAVTAGAIGIVLAMPINGLTSTFGNLVRFSTLAFSFRVTFAIVIEALIFAAVMGTAGGWLPARRR